ncbi:MAG TPA: DNA double-strand break repair nuclease NurA [Acidimicrobiia bacterium]|nr:DNA double-strand break repair nuclease NurA [Acidimicrobiia bacterium]
MSTAAGMRWSVESWDPAYGLPGEALDLADSSADVVVDIELAAADWAPIDVLPVPPGIGADSGVVVFIDGVRRVDARAWVEGPDGSVAPALCATYGAGAVRCTNHPGAAAGSPPFSPGGNGASAGAHIASVLVERGLFTASPYAVDVHTRAGGYPLRTVGSTRTEALPLALQARMAELEIAAAEAACGGGCDLLIVDGPLRGRGHLPNAVGYIKTHQVTYLPPAQHAVVSALTAAQRTPVFATGTAFSRYACYLRLPVAHATPWAGVVRLEVPAELDVPDAVALLARAAGVLPRYASQTHKEPRAPQNLYPIAGLERELRRRLGDEALLYRALRVAAA